MKILLSLTILAAGLLLAAGDSQDASKKISELHKEWIATLRQLVDVSKKSHNGGAVSAEVVIESRQMLLNAERDASETNEDRIKFQEGIIELLKEKEKLRGTLHRSTQGTQMNALKAKAERLKAEIDLEELKGHGGKPMQ